MSGVEGGDPGSVADPRMRGFRSRAGVEALSAWIADQVRPLAAEDVLLVEAGENVNLTRASRNLKGVKLVPTKEVNVYDLLKYREVLLSETAAKKLSEALA